MKRLTPEEARKLFEEARRWLAYIDEEVLISRIKRGKFHRATVFIERGEMEEAEREMVDIDRQIELIRRLYAEIRKPIWRYRRRFPIR